MCDVEIKDILQCRGHTSIPDTWEELVENRIVDDWNINVKCVISGKKHVAVTDYDSFEDPEEVSSYYDMFGGIQLHIELLDQAEKCGVLYIVDRKGTHYFHKPYAEINAKLLIQYGFIDSSESLPENIDMDIYRSLLMGYTDLSIILYRLVNEYDQKIILYEGEMIEDVSEQRAFLNDDNYMDKVDEYIKYYKPIIKEIRDFIKSQGGVLFKD